MPDASDGGPTRTAALATTLLASTIACGWLAGAQSRPAWLVGGVVATAVAEMLAYQRHHAVRSRFERPTTGAIATAIGGVAIGTGAILAPDRSLSFAVGALLPYLCLLGVVLIVGWQPDGVDRA